MLINEKKLLKRLDDLNAQIRALRDRIKARDDEDENLNDEDADAAADINEEDRDDGTVDDEEELIEQLEELIEEYEETEERLKKLRERNARVESVAYRHAERAAQTDRIGAPVMPHTDPKNTRNGRHQYSLMRAIRGQVNAILGQGPGLDGLELEVHRELSQVRGKPGAGVLVPWDAGVPGLQHRQLSTITGAGAVPMHTIPTMIDVLRARLVLVGLGANLITDQTQPFALPKTVTTVTGTHVETEGTSPAKQNPTIEDIEFTYKSIEAHTKLTRQFINGSSVSAEAYIVDQLTKAVATALENACLNGTGADGQPKGLLKMTNAADGIGVKSLGTNGAKPAWTDVVALTGMVDTANAPNASRGFLTNPTMVAYFQSAPKEEGHPVYILGDSGTINGYGYASTSLVPNNLTKGTGENLSAIAFGAWEEMLIALFTGLDLFVDPFSGQPHVNVAVAQDYDMHLAHGESFALIVDAQSE